MVLLSPHHALTTRPTRHNNVDVPLPHRLVSSFAGHALTMRAYEEAVKEKYRFYSFGDSMLIL
jgi:hypothetical protein